MNQLAENKSASQQYSISRISGKIQRDIAYLRENLEIIEEDYENKLVEDIERFFLDDIATEIRLSIYDPLENNRVYLEYCYKAQPLSSSVLAEKKWDSHVKLWDFPDTCLFDIFIYFSMKFAELKPEFQKEFLKDFNLDWYDLSFNLKYSKKDKRKKAGAVSSDELLLNRFIYESPTEEQKRAEPKKQVDTEPVAFSEKDRNRTGKFSKFEKELIKVIQGGHKLNFVIYKDMESAAMSIGYVLHQYNKIPVRWSLSRGFSMEKLSRHDAGDLSSMRGIKNPSSALNFIIENVEERVSYIFEDFHHHIGGASAINTAVAEIRSIIRELSRNLRERNEYVFFLSPSDSLPAELVPAFNIVKQEAEGKNISFLNRYGYDMTDPELCGRSKPVIGKDDKIKRIIQILCQMETNNPVLVGEAGVGKTALIEGLASEIVKGNVPSALKGKTIFSINLNTLVAGSKYRGDFEERIHQLLDEVKSNYGDIIVFIDEIHTLLGAGSAEGAAGAEDILKPALARGDFPCIGATTNEGYECILKDPALARRFQKMDIQPATVNEAGDVLRGVKHVFEKHHDVKITDDAVKAAVKLSEEWIHDQYLPGKAVRLLDSTSAFVKLDDRQIVDAKDIDDEVRRSRS